MISRSTNETRESAWLFDQLDRVITRAHTGEGRVWSRKLLVKKIGRRKKGKRFSLSREIAKEIFDARQIVSAERRRRPGIENGILSLSLSLSLGVFLFAFVSSTDLDNPIEKLLNLATRRLSCLSGSLR